MKQADQLDAFLSLPRSSHRDGQSRSARVAANASLVWAILDFGSPQQNLHGNGIFLTSLQSDLQLHPREAHRNILLEDPNFDSDRPDESSPVYGRYASPPDWFGRTGEQTDTNLQTGYEQVDMMQPSTTELQAMDDPTIDPMSWLWPPVDMNIMYGMDQSRWDAVNL